MLTKVLPLAIILLLPPMLLQQRIPILTRQLPVLPYGKALLQRLLLQILMLLLLILPHKKSVTTTTTTNTTTNTNPTTDKKSVSTVTTTHENNNTDTTANPTLSQEKRCYNNYYERKCQILITTTIRTADKTCVTTTTTTNTNTNTDTTATPTLWQATRHHNNNY